MPSPCLLFLDLPFNLVAPMLAGRFRAPETHSSLLQSYRRLPWTDPWPGSRQNVDVRSRRRVKRPPRIAVGAGFFKKKPVGAVWHLCALEFLISYEETLSLLSPTVAIELLPVPTWMAYVGEKLYIGLGWLADLRRIIWCCISTEYTVRHIPELSMAAPTLRPHLTIIWTGRATCWPEDRSGIPR